VNGVELVNDDTVYVWVARVQDRRDETETTAWSAVDKARSWCEWRLDANMSWQNPEGDRGHEPITGYAAGAEVAEIRRVEVQDPLGLAQLYPESLPANRYIPDR